MNVSCHCSGGGGGESSSFVFTPEQIVFICRIEMLLLFAQCVAVLVHDIINRTGETSTLLKSPTIMFDCIFIWSVIIPSQLAVSFHHARHAAAKFSLCTTCEHNAKCYELDLSLKKCFFTFPVLLHFASPLKVTWFVILLVNCSLAQGQFLSAQENCFTLKLLSLIPVV